MNVLTPHVEALIFCSNSPIGEKEIKNCLQEHLGREIPDKELEDSLKHLLYKYSSSEYSFQVRKIAGGYQFLSKEEYRGAVDVLMRKLSKKRLSASAMETLSIIAYKQPVTKGQIEQIRGVGSDYAIQKLLEKELVEMKGKSDAIGRPILYGTSSKFMEYFGIDSIKNLPSPKDFGQEEQNLDKKD